MNKYILEFTVFLCGAVVMVFELVGSRLLAPYVGTSIYVWTSLIGVILGSLSLGYWAGGKIADKKANYDILAYIIFLSALFIGFIIFIGNDILRLLTLVISDIRWSSLLGSLLLFAVPSVLLGTISPYAVKLKIDSLNNSGRIVGNLYAISTVGSIVGTFFAGFLFIPMFGNLKILFLISFTLLCLSFLIFFKKKRYYSLVILLLFLIIIFFYHNLFKENGISINTKYSTVNIIDAKWFENDKKIRVMNINNESNSAMFLESDDLVFSYTKYYDLAKHFYPNFKKSLMIGGGAYSYPKYYLTKFPEATIDVVEIDDKLAEISKQYFRLKDDERLKIYHEDARIFLNQTKNKYDVVFGDAFKSFYSVPYHLTTVEAVEKIYNILNDDGVALINLISAIEGDGGKFLRAEYFTYKKYFPNVYLFRANDLTSDSFEVQNIMLVALKSDNQPSLISEDKNFSEYLENVWTKKISQDVPFLTDDYAPIESYLSSVVEVK